MTSTPLVGQTLFGINLGNLKDSIREIRRSISKRVLILEFQKSQLVYAEVKVSSDSFIITKLNKVDLPEEAIDRGVPLDPEKMSFLIKEICKEDNIFARRTIYILPPEASFSKLINLPSNLSIQEAREYINNPKTSLQIPIPLKQTDYDLKNTNLKDKKINNKLLKFFYLTTIPKKLTDQIIKTLELSDLELQGIELSFLSQIRLIDDEMSYLRNDEGLVILDLLKECSYVNFITKSGVIFSERITAIREFPPSLIEKEDLENISPNEISKEEIIYKHENYLPPSLMDIKTIHREFTKILDLNSEILGNFKFKKLYLIGINSGHKNINDIISEKFKLPTKTIRPVSNKNISKINFNDFFLHQSLATLLGASLGLKPKTNLENNLTDKNKLDAINHRKISLKNYLNNFYNGKDEKGSKVNAQNQKISSPKKLIKKFKSSLQNFNSLNVKNEDSSKDIKKEDKLNTKNIGSLSQADTSTPKDLKKEDKLNTKNIGSLSQADTSTPKDLKKEDKLNTKNIGSLSQADTSTPKDLKKEDKLNTKNIGSLSQADTSTPKDLKKEDKLNTKNIGSLSQADTSTPKDLKKEDKLNTKNIGSLSQADTSTPKDLKKEDKLNTKNIGSLSQADTSTPKDLKKEDKLNTKNIGSLSQADTSTPKDLKKEDKLNTKNIGSTSNSSLDDLKFTDK